MEQARDDDFFTGGLGQLVNGYRATQAVYVVAKLGIADHLASAHRSTEELAKESDTDASSLRRVLRVASALGVLEEVGDDEFALAPMAQRLRSDVPGSMRPMAILAGEDFFWKPWGKLIDAVKTGEDTFASSIGATQSDYVKANPEALELFQGAMTGGTESQLKAINENYDFSRFDRVADVGGGHGALLTSILDANPEIHGMLVEQPKVAEGARKFIGERDLLDRCDVIGADIVQELPISVKLIMMKAVVHGMSDELTTQTLKNCHKALPKDGTLLIIERVVTPHGTPSMYTLSDLNMLVMTRSRGSQRTERDYRELLNETGFRLIRTIETDAEVSILEAVKS